MALRNFFFQFSVVSKRTGEGKKESARGARVSQLRRKQNQTRRTFVQTKGISVTLVRRHPFLGSRYSVSWAKRQFARAALVCIQRSLDIRHIALLVPSYSITAVPCAIVAYGIKHKLGFRKPYNPGVRRPTHTARAISSTAITAKTLFLKTVKTLLYKSKKQKHAGVHETLYHT